MFLVAIQDSQQDELLSSFTKDERSLREKIFKILYVINEIIFIFVLKIGFFFFWIHICQSKDAKDVLHKDVHASLKDKSHLSEMVSVFPRHVPRFTKTSRLYVFDIFNVSTKTSKLPKTDWSFSWWARVSDGIIFIFLSCRRASSLKLPRAHRLRLYLGTSGPSSFEQPELVSASGISEECEIDEGLWYEIETWSGVSEGQSIPWQRVLKRFRGNWILSLHGRLIEILE